jgi:hypothetical protein
MAFAEMMKSLMMWTILLTGYADPGGYPDINYVPAAQLNHMICPSAPKGCGILGVYHNGKIYLDEEQDLSESIYARSILVHEITHWLQDLNNDYNSFGRLACEQANQREVEAYGVQNAYLRQAEKSGIMVRNQAPMCTRWFTITL